MPSDCAEVDNINVPIYDDMGVFDVVKDESIMDFKGGSGSDWLFYRKFESKHNTMVPDIKIKLIFE